MAGAYGIRRRIWLAALVAVLGTGAVVALVLRAAAERRAHRPTSPSGEGQELAFAGPRLQHPEALPGLPDSLEGLIDVYARRTDDPSARAQRGAALRAIFRETDPSRRLFAALAAVAADPTPPEADPLWPEVIQQLSRVWQEEVASRGLDLMLAESRPRARQAVISSFAHLAATGQVASLSRDQRTTMTNDFIDLFAHLSPVQQTEIQQGLRGMGERDIADVLRGKGVRAGDELEIERAHEKALQESKQAATTP